MRPGIVRSLLCLPGAYRLASSPRAFVTLAPICAESVAILFTWLLVKYWIPPLLLTGDLATLPQRSPNREQSRNSVTAERKSVPCTTERIPMIWVSSLVSAATVLEIVKVTPLPLIFFTQLLLLLTMDACWSTEALAIDLMLVAAASYTTVGTSPGHLSQNALAASRSSRSLPLRLSTRALAALAMASWPCWVRGTSSGG